MGITQLGRVFVQNTEMKKNLEFFNPDLDQQSVGANPILLFVRSYSTLTINLYWGLHIWAESLFKIQK
jgi:hypothetical protein